MSRSDTGRLTVAAMRRLGLPVVDGPVPRDAVAAADARVVATQCSHGRFAAAVRACAVGSGAKRDTRLSGPR
jgi:hypothetical protein